MSCSAKAPGRKDYNFEGQERAFEGRRVEGDVRADRYQHRKKNIARRAGEEGIVTLYRKRGDEKGTVYDLSLSPRQSAQHAESHCFLETDGALIAWLLEMAAESPTARSLVACAGARGWNCRMDDLGGAGYAIDAESKILCLDHSGFKPSAIGRSIHYRNMLALHFIKGLRQIWQSEHRTRQRTQTGSALRPDAALMLARAHAADCESVSILVAWEWRGAGNAEPWRVLLGGDEGDMAIVFTRALEKDPAGFYDGSVLARTFCQWYAQETRIGASDSATLATLDDALRKGDGRGAEALTPAHVESVSALPGGAAYLSGMGEAICRDPYFLSLNDPINEAHLFQIVHDSTAHMAGGVAFRDPSLARRIFPVERVKLTD
jgi:hypothetical protein